MEAQLFDRIRRSLESMQTLGVGAPYLVVVQLRNTARLSLSYFESRTISAEGFDRENATLPELVLDEEPSNLPMALRPLFDALWQASGFSADPYYDDNFNTWKLLVPHERLV
jgi:hypothetical protein